MTTTAERKRAKPGGFVGRERELAALDDGLCDAEAGRGRLFVVRGEPGIGKTRLVEQLTTRGSTKGAKVLWGRCWEARDGFHALPRDNYWLAAMALLSEVAVFLRETETARFLYESLLPYAGRQVLAGPGIYYAGPVSRALGLLAGALSRHDETVERLEAALAECEKIGARIYAVRTAIELAEALRIRGTAGDGEWAGSLLQAAAAEAEALELTSLSERIRPLRDKGRSAKLHGEAVPAYVLRREALFWTICADGGRVSHLKDMKGLHLLTHLLRNPGVAFSPLELRELAGATAPSDSSSGRDQPTSSAAERARVAATKAIRAAIGAIAKEDEALGQHLQGAVRTGKAFCYEPGEPAAIRWRV